MRVPLGPGSKETLTPGSSPGQGLAFSLCEGRGEDGYSGNAGFGVDTCPSPSPKGRGEVGSLERAVIDSWIQTQIRQLTLEQKVGQMLMAGFPGTTLTPEVAHVVKRCHLGGVMLWEANVESPAQTAALTADLRRVSAEDAGLPLFVCLDQEGGAVSRLDGPATVMPSAMALGATRSLDHVRAWARALGAEMRALGIDVDFAPVLDVNSEPANPVIGIRSFGDSPSLVAEMGVATIEALHEAGIMATAKHFPGHGGTATDSHLDLPVIRRNRELLRAVDLPPFQAAIASGVEIIMTAHAVYPALASDHLPATISSEILTDLLRNRMGFQGLIVTDALVMSAIADRYTLAEAAVQSILAGADLALVLTTLDEQVQVFEELLQAVRRGEISEARIDASVSRILAAKARLASTPTVDGLDFAIWPIEEHRRLARDIAHDSITLVRNDAGLLPLRLQNGERLGVVEFGRARFSPVEDPVCENGWLRRLFNERYPNVRHLCLDPALKGGESEMGSIVAECDVLVVVTRNANIIRRQSALVRRIVDSGKPTVVAAVRGPYDVMSFPSVGSYVVSYGDAPACLEALAEVLFGDHLPKGKLPVAIPGLFPYGHGLEGF